jgi:hypothetical protein
MRKLLILMFTFAVAFSLVLPVFAQDAAAAGQENAPKAEKKAKKEKKKHTFGLHRKAKKEKKEAKEGATK